jgi:hypothetical protein
MTLYLRQAPVNISAVQVQPIQKHDEQRYQELMSEHHYLGKLPKIGETLWYIAHWHSQWLALICYSAAAWKCAARDQWIGWSPRHQYDRLKLIVNNSRFLILPEWHIPNLGSHILSLCQKRVSADWQNTFGHPVLLLETFVDPLYFHGTVYKAANWQCVGSTKGFHRSRNGYSSGPGTSKLVFIKPLNPNAKTLLSNPFMEANYHTGGTNLMLSSKQMLSLPHFFKDIPDPRRRQGRRHGLSTVLGIATGATLCGMRGYKAMSDWAKSLGAKARQRFGCSCVKGSYIIPSEFVIRDLLVRVDPVHLDNAFQRWNEVYGKEDQSLAIDGKTMCNAINDKGQQTHIMSAIGHDSKQCYTQKK